MQPKILIADDHSMIRKGLKLNIQLTLGYTDMEEVATCNDLMKELIKTKIRSLEHFTKITNLHIRQNYYELNKLC